jgi:hypothetical protein
MHENEPVMKSLPTFASVAAVVLAAFGLASAHSVIAGQESDNKPKPENPAKREAKDSAGPNSESQKERGSGDPLRHLTPEEREEFREAMRRAWDDPAVLQARDEVKKATTAYQKALNEAIGRKDPNVVALLKKIRDANESPGDAPYPPGGQPGGRNRAGGGSGGGFRDFEAFLTGGSPSFLNKLSEEQREIYRMAKEKALKSPEFQEVFGKLREMRLHDDELRNKRIELFGRARLTLNTEMLKADKRVKDFLPKDHFAPKGPGSGPPPKKPEGTREEAPIPPKKPGN